MSARRWLIGAVLGMSGILAAQEPLQSVPTFEGISRPSPPNMSSSDRQEAIRSQLTVEVNAASTIPLNAPAEYKIVLRNSSNAPTGALEVQADLPEHLRFQTGRPEPTQAGNTLRWQLAGVAGNSDQTLVFSAIASQRLPVQVKVSTRLLLATGIQANVTEPILQLDLTGPKEAEVGDEFEVMAKVANAGDAPITGGGLSFQLSDGLQLVRSPNQNNAFTLTPGKFLQTPLQVRAVAAGDQGVRSIAIADGKLRKEAEHEIMVRRPMLEIELRGPIRRFAGLTANYNLAVRNAGDIAAKGSIAFMEMPASVKYVASNPPAYFDQDRHLLFWRLGDLESRGQRQLEVQLKPTVAGPVELRGSVKDAKKAAADGFLNLEVVGRTALFFEMIPDGDLMAVGEQLQLRFLLANKGQTPPQQLTIELDDQGAFEFIPTQSAGWKQGKRGFINDSVRVANEGEQETVLTLKALQPMNGNLEAIVSGPQLAGRHHRIEPIRVTEAGARGDRTGKPQPVTPNPMRDSVQPAQPFESNVPKSSTKPFADPPFKTSEPTARPKSEMPLPPIGLPGGMPKSIKPEEPVIPKKSEFEAPSRPPLEPGLGLPGAGNKKDPPAPIIPPPPNN